MNLNKNLIIFYPAGGRQCSYCGISSFTHHHPPNTLPKDFIVGDGIHQEADEEQRNVYVRALLTLLLEQVKSGFFGMKHRGFLILNLEEVIKML